MFADGLAGGQQGSVVSVLLLGAMAGVLGAGRIADRLGRRTTLGLEGAVFVSGTAIAAALSVGYWTPIAALLVLGLAVGAASATVPVYLSEVMLITLLLLLGLSFVAGWSSLLSLV
jgi:MFS family permease